MLWPEQATFLDGHPLGLTLFTCLYFRPEALRLLSNSATSGPRRVLRALLRGVIQTAEMMWEELAKAQVYDVSRGVSLCVIRADLSHTETARRRSPSLGLAVLLVAARRLLSRRRANSTRAARRKTDSRATSVTRTGRSSRVGFDQRQRRQDTRRAN